MATPNYSETTYAFLLLSELQAKHGGGPIYPTFLTQQQEGAPGGGYDATVNLSGAIHFLQFKRSHVMSYVTAQELASGDFTGPPVFRMNLRKKNGYYQHTQLNELEADGQSVLYASSGASSQDQLKTQCQIQTVVNSSGFFRPSEIIFSADGQQHFVSFVPSSPYFHTYSQEGRRAKREIPNEEAFLRYSAERRKTNRQNLAALGRFVGDLVPSVFPGQPESIVQRAALWARMRYDCELILLPD